jgi:methyl-accepting chemotaxis protein
MRCDDLVDALAAAADGSELLGRSERRHVERCLRCQAELVQHRKVLRAMRTLRTEVLEPAPGLLADILAGIENVSAMMERIAAGAADQRSVVGEIGHQVSAIDSGIEAVLNNTQDTERSCRQLADQSAALHREVGRFKLA